MVSSDESWGIVKFSSLFTRPEIREVYQVVHSETEGIWLLSVNYN
jgi:hypothetical protein